MWNKFDCYRLNLGRDFMTKKKKKWVLNLHQLRTTDVEHCIPQTKNKMDQTKKKKKSGRKNLNDVLLLGCLRFVYRLGIWNCLWSQFLHVRMDMWTDSTSGLLSSVYSDLSMITLALHQQDEMKCLFNTDTEAETNWATGSAKMSCILYSILKKC